MTTFNPWTATLDEAVKQPAAYEPQGAISQWHGAQKLKAIGDVFSGGNGFDILEAVALCAVHNLAMPDWLAIEFLKRYRAVQQCNVDSWSNEKAFGQPYKKGTQIASLKRRRVNTYKVAKAVRNAIEKNHSGAIDTFFWEQIGQEIGEGKTRAQELHAKAVLMGLTQSPADQKNKAMGNPTKSRKLAGIQKLR